MISNKSKFVGSIASKKKKKKGQAKDDFLFLVNNYGRYTKLQESSMVSQMSIMVSMVNVTSIVNKYYKILVI